VIESFESPFSRVKLRDNACPREGGLDIISPERWFRNTNIFMPDLKAGGCDEEKDPDCR
jgi:hypothetical protein